MNDEDPSTPPTSASSSDSASASPSAGPATEEIPPTGPFFSRDHLVRPRQGRYVAGVCVALARATNTDPVLWRVLVAVLGILSGVGVLLYLIGWLIIPAEGDTASPIESLLGKGRSGMAPLSVVLLGAAAVISFGFIVHDGMRASLLAAAVILGAVLLIKRSNGTTFPSAPPPTEPPVGFPSAPGEPVAAYAPASFGAPPAAPGPAAEPVTEKLPPRPPFSPPPSGYRPPFAPHGPWAGTGTHQGVPLQVPRPPKPPKPPRERSKLGRLTFFAVLMVLGTMAAIGMAGASIAVSAYFAAALITIALGLIVGAWFGRARGLIALAILTSIGLFISNGVERWGGEVGKSVYRPQTIAAVADRYDFTAGSATLDLRDVDFTGQTQSITMTMKVGQMRVLLPPTVDTVADVQLDGGRAVLFGQEFTGDRADTTKSVTDLGTDGTGGGTLKLDLQMDTGNVEVLR
ncbi:phage shock protein PspC (stress-responsive transcriptional regulator) [Actinoplanes tereljensis]|uniref:PspC family transcriptional regulator n=1 Tax=Paractinoplanes tereljensis TaxID=571912 RepID=A0A919NK65_9ACTN|nr:PspC domain-containing protein [Actinoplanes tereljensis]GIF19367.1 PspC family transcriptional regulator [Actinoplanes tereljensis]